MRILIALEDKTLGEYLNNQGHETKTVFVNDIVLYAAQHFSAEVVIYFTSVVKTENHEDVIKALCSRGLRVILAAEKNDPIRAYSAALGITDLLNLPVEPAEVLHRLVNPASKEEAAEAMRQAAVEPRQEKEKKDGPALRLPKISLFRQKKNQEEVQAGGRQEEPADTSPPVAIVDEDKNKEARFYAEENNADDKETVQPVRPLEKLRVTGGIGRLLAGSPQPVEKRREQSSPGQVPVWKIPAAEHDPGVPASAEESTTFREDYRKEPFQTRDNIADDSCLDVLTGCYNRRYLTERCALNGPYSVVFIDLDGFKTVNDVLGHEAGDQVLAAFGKMLVENLKGQDIAVRWGGDEFVLVLPETAPEDAEAVVENLRSAWDRAMPRMGGLRVGLSAGVSSGRGNAGLQDAIKEADRLMYAEKKVRKTREAWGPPKANLPAMPELPENVWMAAKKGLVLAVNIIAVVGMVSAVVWAADYAMQFFGGYSPYLHEAARVVEWFWKTVYAGLTGIPRL